MNLKVQLNSHQDKKGNLYYVGKVFAPLNLDLSRGAAFLIFISEQGDEELQIAYLDEESQASYFYVEGSKIKAKIEKRIDANEQSYFLAKIRGNLLLSPDKDKGISFVIFTSKEGREELQIGGSILEIRAPEIEIIRRPARS